MTGYPITLEQATAVRAYYLEHSPAGQSSDCDMYDAIKHVLGDVSPPPVAVDNLMIHRGMNASRLHRGPGNNAGPVEVSAILTAALAPEPEIVVTDEDLAEFSKTLPLFKNWLREPLADVIRAVRKIDRERASK